METKHCPSCGGTLYYRASSDSYRCRKCGETWGQMAMVLHEQEERNRTQRKVADALEQAGGAQ